MVLAVPVYLQRNLQHDSYRHVPRLSLSLSLTVKSTKLGYDPKNECILFVAMSKGYLTRNLNVILPFRNKIHQITNINYLDSNQIDISNLYIHLTRTYIIRI